MSNNSTSTTTSDMTTWYEYIVIGTAAILSNTVLIFILVTNKTFLKKSAFIAGLAVGDLLDGVALLGNGVRRIYMIHHGTIIGNIHPSYCMQTFTPVFLLGNQIPGVMFFLVGLERFIAVHYFDWYYTTWTSKLAWTYTGLAYLFCAISLCGAYVLTYLQPTKVVIPIACNTPSVMGPYYISFNYIVSIVGGTVAVVMTIAALIIFTKKNKKLSKTNVASNVSARVKRECRQSRVMLSIAALDLALVVVPNILLTLTNGFRVIRLNATWSLQVISSRSVLNIFIYYFMNLEFRQATFNTFRCKKNSATVEPFVSTIGPLHPKYMTTAC